MRADSAPAPWRRRVEPSTGREPWCGMGTYRVLALLVVLAVLLLVGTGGWVRLSESGLGCPTWPKCYGTGLVAHASYHALTEFVNRCVITATAGLVGLTILAAVPARRSRPDLLWLSTGLFAGYVAEAVLGGLTVLAKLAPALVAAHLVVAMLLLADAVVLHWRAVPGPWAPTTPASGNVRLLASVLLGAVGVVVVLGTVATGSGPDAGSGHVVRFGLPFRATVELHAVVGMFLAGLIAASFFAIRGDRTPPSALRAYEIVLSALVLQIAIGYTQYFSGLPVGVVEAHILGAGILVVALVRFRLVLGGSPAGSRRPRRIGPAV